MSRGCGCSIYILSTCPVNEAGSDPRMDPVPRNVHQNSEDDASSVYSRSPGPPTHRRGGCSISSLPDRPEITQVDHQIGDIQGSTVALETTASRLRVTKAMRSESAAQRRQTLEDELAWHKWENDFYGTCHDLFEELLLATVEVSEDLLSQSQMRILQHYFEPEVESTDNNFLSRAVRNLDTALQSSRVCEAAAERKWKECWRAKSGQPSSLSWV
jgi:hypothetical protein